MSEPRLAPCPSAANCVSSRADSSDQVHFIEPLRIDGPRDAAMARVRASVLDMPRTALLEERPGYLKVLFKTRFVRFRDDVELEWAAEGVVHVRSASRLGYDDLGVNRARVGALREKLALAR